MFSLNYQKRKNLELFKIMENPSTLFLSNTQNYIPIYKKFFSLNETNYNSINLNNKFYISTIKNSVDNNELIYDCKVKNINNNNQYNKHIFFKLAPLLEPTKYLIGKYNILDKNLFNLPTINSTDKDCNEKVLDPNNFAYVDGLFLFISSCLIHNHNFINGVDFFGSFLGIKNNFKFNIFDDLDYLTNYDFFNKNKGILFSVDDYEHLFESYENKLKPINIDYGNSSKSKLSAKSINEDLFDDIFENDIDNKDIDNIDNNIIDNNKITHLKDLNNDLEDLTNVNLLKTLKADKSLTIKSSSTCSSRTSYTTNDENDDTDKNNNDKKDDDNNINKCSNCDDNEENGNVNRNNETNNNNGIDEKEEDEETIWEEEESFDDEEELINATIPKFPVHVIAMENCDDTFDNLIIENELSDDEWFSALMQVIMILITYQKAFNFTHNDLHTSNVMYNDTTQKYIYYRYNNKYYKVPTFGRIFKIIDFGRSIYKYNSKLFCSDSFQIGGDASTQYNFEPYFNEQKPRVEPNYSFDLCRLACSIFDYLVEDINDIKELSQIKNPVTKLIVEWCLDDKGINMLYKNNGVDRYPDFKLYKMIARCVHNHTPQEQLNRPEFSRYSKFKEDVPKNIVDIDNIPCYI